ECVHVCVCVCMSVCESVSMFVGVSMFVCVCLCLGGCVRCSRCESLLVVCVDVCVGVCHVCCGVCVRVCECCVCVVLLSVGASLLEGCLVRSPRQVWVGTDVSEGCCSCVRVCGWCSAC